MYRCHLCNLETKQLNGLLSRHWKKHIQDRLLYKREVLIANGRLPKNCKICLKETIIPKGEAEYPDYCKSCYIIHMISNPINNPNWSGGKQIFLCKQCGKQKETYFSQLTGKYNFCSSICSMVFYNKGENWNEARKARSSKKERLVLAHIKTIYKDVIDAYLLDRYIFDGFIPSRSILIEFDGTYWHSLEAAIKGDTRKSSYVEHNYPQLELIRIPEKEWDLALNKLEYLKKKLGVM